MTFFWRSRRTELPHYHPAGRPGNSSSMGNDISTQSHTLTVDTIAHGFATQYEQHRTEFDQVVAQISATTIEDPAKTLVTFQQNHDCILVLLNEYLIVIKLNHAKVPSLLDVIELETPDEMIFGPVQRTGNDFQLKITSALNTSYLVKFLNIEAMKHWEATLNETITTLKQDNATDERSRTTSTEASAHDPLEAIGNAVVAVSNQDVHWNVDDQGVIGHGQPTEEDPSRSGNTKGETKRGSSDSLDTDIQKSMASVQEALSNGMLPLHQDHAAGGIFHSGPLTELRGHALRSATKHPKWVEIIDDVFIYYDWDHDKAPEHHEKCKGSPKFIDLELIESVHVGVLKNDESIFGACCGTRVGLDDANIQRHSNDTNVGEEGATSMFGFSVFWKKKGKNVAASFLTKSTQEAEKWVTMINDCKPCNPSNMEKDVEQFDAFMNNCNNGDVLLFRGKKINNKLLRGITRSKYDHVGMVVRGTAGAYLLDATGDGICLHSFEKFKKKGWYKPYQYVCRRALKWTNNAGAAEMPKIYVQRLHTFVEKTVGMPYRLTPSSLMNKSSTAKLKQNRGYFCSELVAAAYQHMGVLGPNPEAQKYWPGTFQSTLAKWDHFNLKMKECVTLNGNNCLPHLDRVERRILWEGGVRSKSSRGGCFG